MDEPMPDPKGQAKTYTISQLAAEFEISPRTIRFYEEKGLLTPRRTESNRRFYERRDRARLRLILRGKRFGYSLEEIAEMIGLAEVDPDEAVQIRRSLAFGERKLAEIRERTDELVLLEKDLRAMAARLHQRLAQLESGNPEDA
jgi:DNA-binding transcriptional MerR regulator